MSWISSLIGVYLWTYYLAGNWAGLVTLVWGLTSGLGLFFYLRSRKSKFHSTKIELGKGKGFLLPINDNVNTK